MSATLSILHLIPYLGPRSFGLGPVALNLALEQLRLGHDTEIWCLDTPADRQWAAETSGFPVERIRIFPLAGFAALCYSPAMEQAVIGPAGARFAVMHQHGLWTMNSRVPYLWRKKTGLPTVISPHGSLSAWSLKKSKWKKQLALLGYERRHFAAAACFHALSQRELNDCRAFGQTNPVAIIPSGIGEAWLASQGDGRRFRRQHNIPEDKNIALFLSRITPVKGLPMLFHAIDRLRQTLGDWVFLIAGVDEFNYLAECQRLTRELQLAQWVHFVGPLFNEAKLDGFAAADLFILPSYSEGAPIVVLEALGAGVPVLTTKGAPWDDLERHQCGWWADISVDGITTALSAATGTARKDLTSMGARGKHLVTTRYTWQQSARNTVALYEWLLQQGPQPDFVDTEQAGRATRDRSHSVK